MVIKGFTVFGMVSSMGTDAPLVIFSSHVKVCWAWPLCIIHSIPVFGIVSSMGTDAPLVIFSSYVKACWASGHCVLSIQYQYLVWYLVWVLTPRLLFSLVM